MLRRAAADTEPKPALRQGIQRLDTMGMLDRVRSEKSGRIVMGGNRCGGPLAGKNYIEPTIITDVDPKSEIGQIEVFGPVLLVLKFKDEDEAVALANDTKYGLAAGYTCTSIVLGLVAVYLATALVRRAALR